MPTNKNNTGKIDISKLFNLSIEELKEALRTVDYYDLLDVDDNVDEKGITGAYRK